MALPTVRSATEADLPAIRDLLLDGGARVLEGVSFEGAAPYWLVAEKFGTIVGCIQVLIGKPIGLIDQFACLKSLTKRRKAEAAIALNNVAVEVATACGVSVMMTLVTLPHYENVQKLGKLGWDAREWSTIMVRRAA
jgi:N-acetylglutamate synthase-like GNAT family acetyltransferase